MFLILAHDLNRKPFTLFGSYLARGLSGGAATWHYSPQRGGRCPEDIAQVKLREKR
jgi:hypothetical protein